MSKKNSPLEVNKQDAKELLIEEKQLEEQKAQDVFAAKMLTIINDGMLCLAVSIGHRTNLFETMANMPAASSKAIALEAGLNERYVREWLGAMVTGRIVDYFPTSKTYSLPEAHAAILTSMAGANNLSRLTQIVPLLAGVSPSIEDCFKQGGGVDYSAYKEFMGLWSTVNGERLNNTFIKDVIPLVPGLAADLDKGIDVLDVGCGNGHALLLLAKAFPGSNFTGIDLVESNIQTANKNAEARNLSNVHFIQCDIEQYALSKKYQLITALDVVHDLASPEPVLHAVKSILTRNGVFLMVDLAASSELEKNLDHPLGPWLYTSSCMHCVTVSLAQEGEGLGAMWGEEKALQLLQKSGFTNVGIEKIANDPFNNYYIAKH